jgi:glycine hydroxymethyltransferase
MNRVLANLLSHIRLDAERLHMVPSENSMSLLGHLPYMTDVLYRYCFAAEGGENWAWPGQAHIAEIERDLIAELGGLYGARYVNVKPISGLNCMTTVLAAMPSDDMTLFTIGEADGGHAATRYIAGRFGFRTVDIPFDSTSYSVDPEALADRARGIPGPKAAYLDQFMCLFPQDLAGIRGALGSEAWVHYDGSHVMGLIAGGQFQDPLREGADSLAGSTHKSFPGPHKGIVLTNSRWFDERIAVSAGYVVSHHHAADVVALALVLAEMRPSLAEYARSVVRNARSFAGALAAHGFAVCGEERGFTRSHQVWLDVSPWLDATEASQILLKAGIVVNAIPIPYLKCPAGLRVGVQEVTRLGMDETAMIALADIFRAALIDKRAPCGLKNAVLALKQAYVDPCRRRDAAALEGMITGALDARMGATGAAGDLWKLWVAAPGGSGS